MAVRAGDWGIGLYACIFSIGLLFVAGMSVSQSGTVSHQAAHSTIHTENKKRK
jgi:hypothetical protein